MWIFKCLPTICQTALTFCLYGGPTKKFHWNTNWYPLCKGWSRAGIIPFSSDKNSSIQHYYYTDNYKTRTRIQVVLSSDVFSTIETTKLTDAFIRIGLNTVPAFHLIRWNQCAGNGHMDQTIDSQEKWRPEKPTGVTQAGRRHQLG